MPIVVLGNKIDLQVPCSCCRLARHTSTFFVSNPRSPLHSTHSERHPRVRVQKHYGSVFNHGQGDTRVPMPAPFVVRVSSLHPPSSGQSSSWPAPNRGVHVQRHKEIRCVSRLVPVCRRLRAPFFPFSRSRPQAIRKHLNGSRETCREIPCFDHSTVRSRINLNQKTNILNATITSRCCKRRSQTFQNRWPLGPVFPCCRREERAAAATARRGPAFKAGLERGWRAERARWRRRREAHRAAFQSARREWPRR